MQGSEPQQSNKLLLFISLSTKPVGMYLCCLLIWVFVFWYGYFERFLTTDSEGQDRKKHESEAYVCLLFLANFLAFTINILLETLSEVGVSWLYAACWLSWTLIVQVAVLLKHEIT